MGPARVFRIHINPLHHLARSTNSRMMLASGRSSRTIRMGQESNQIERMEAAPASSAKMENAVSFRNSLFSLGLHLLLHTNRRQSSPAVSLRRHPLPDRRNRLYTAGRWHAANALAQPPRMGLRSLCTGHPDLRPGLRSPFLGGATACSFRPGVGHDGHNPNIHGPVGNRYFCGPRSSPLRLSLALLIGMGGVAVLVSRSLNLGGAPR